MANKRKATAPRADALLAQGAKTFAERSRVYGPTYRLFGDVMAAMLPNGLKVEAGDAATWRRLGVFVQIVSKACRYAAQLSAGGHVDSAHDAMVYAAILEELTRDAARQGGSRDGTC